MTTRVVSNGSKWAGEEPDTVADLLDVLKREPLDPTFERYGNFRLASALPGGRRFWGNFFRVSHVFDIDTNDPETVRAIHCAIIRNKRSDAYRAARKVAA